MLSTFLIVHFCQNRGKKYFATRYFFCNRSAASIRPASPKLATTPLGGLLSVYFPFHTTSIIQHLFLKIKKTIFTSRTYSFCLDLTADEWFWRNVCVTSSWLRQSNTGTGIDVFHKKPLVWSAITLSCNANSGCIANLSFNCYEQMIALSACLCFEGQVVIKDYYPTPFAPHSICVQNAYKCPCLQAGHAMLQLTRLTWRMCAYVAWRWYKNELGSRISNQLYLFRMLYRSYLLACVSVHNAPPNG